MNICILSGVITDVYNFKFIYNKRSKEKCIISFTFKLNDSQEVEIRAFNENVDDVIKNKFKFVYIVAKFVEKMNLELIEIDC